jgi:hypothetical protein
MHDWNFADNEIEAAILERLPQFPLRDEHLVAQTVEDLVSVIESEVRRINKLIRSDAHNIDWKRWLFEVPEEKWRRMCASARERVRQVSYRPRQRLLEVALESANDLRRCRTMNGNRDKWQVHCEALNALDGQWYYADQLPDGFSLQAVRFVDNLGFAARGGGQYGEPLRSYIEVCDEEIRMSGRGMGLSDLFGTGDWEPLDHLGFVVKLPAAVTQDK